MQSPVYNTTTYQLINSALERTKNEMQAIEYVVVGQKIAYIAGKLGYDIKLRPTFFNSYNEPILNPHIFKNHAKICKTIFSHFDSKGSKEKFLKLIKKNKNMSNTLEALFKLGGNVAVENFLKSILNG